MRNRFFTLNKFFWLEEMLNLFVTTAMQTNWSLKPLGTLVKDGSSKNLLGAVDHAQRACVRVQCQKDVSAADVD